MKFKVLDFSDGKVKLLNEATPYDEEILVELEEEGTEDDKNIVIPECITTAVNKVFRNNQTIENLKLSSRFAGFAKYQFEGCTNLKEIVIPRRVKEIRLGDFKDCTNLEKVVLPAGIKKIEEDAFRNCINLESINFPKSLKLVEKNAFFNCKNLRDITFKTKQDIFVRSMKEDYLYIEIIYKGVCYNKYKIHKTAFSNCPYLSEYQPF